MLSALSENTISCVGYVRCPRRQDEPHRDADEEFWSAVRKRLESEALHGDHRQSAQTRSQQRGRYESQWARVLQGKIDVFGFPALKYRFSEYRPSITRLTFIILRNIF